jgi:hypothetical protein
MLRAVSVVCCVSLLACARATERSSVRDPDPTRARAALATLVVDNRSAEPLSVLYRLAGQAGTAVAVGQVRARSVSRMAPVPAGEPLVLLARTSAGLELVLPPRSFTIDGLWTWVVPADARFTRPGGTEAAP